MPNSLPDLESRRADLLDSLSALGDLRPGSIVGAIRRCGNPACHWAQPDDPGHGPSLRLTHQRKGKTIAEALSTPAAVRKAEGEAAAFRKFQKICRLRPSENASPATQGKNGGRDRKRNRARIRPACGATEN